MLTRSKETIKRDIVANEKDNIALKKELEATRAMKAFIFERDLFKEMLINDGYTEEELDNFLKAKFRVKEL